MNYLTRLILFTTFYFIAYIPPIRSIVYNSYAISHLVIIITIIIQPPTVYTTPRYNLTYTHCNSCPPYTFTNQILTHSPQLAAMIICPTVNETNIYTFVTDFHYKQRFKFLAWLNLKTHIHTHTHTPTPIYTHILTATHKGNLNGFLSIFCRIFDFQFHSIFLTAWRILL